MSNKKVAQLLMSIYRSRYTQFFRVCFGYRDPKRQGEIRWMTCKLSDKYTKGGELLYDVLKKRLICVMDVELIDKYKKGEVKSCYRNINLDDIYQLNIEGMIIKVEGKEIPANATK